MNIMGLVGEDPYEAEHLAREAVLWYVRKGFELVSSVAAASQTDESYKYLKTASKFDPAKFTTDYYDFLKDGDLIAVGAADEAVRVANRYRELGADQVLFFLQYGGIPHDRIMKSIELIGDARRDHSWKTRAEYAHLKWHRLQPVIPVVDGKEIRESWFKMSWAAGIRRHRPT